MVNQADRTDLKRLLQGAQLPALPQSAIRLLELSQNPDNGPAEFAVPIEADPGLTGQVLKFVNSSYFCFAREISSVKLAITLVGIRTVKNFALWSAVFSLMPNPKCGPFDLKKLWQDSLRRGLFARAVAKLLGMKDGEEVFAAGLLQDMAVPLLAKALPEDYVVLLGGRKDAKARLSDLEMARFGWNHAQAAGQMARSWNMPEAFASLVECHTDINALLAEGKASPAKIAVSLSSLLPTDSDETWSECSQLEDAYGRICPVGGVPLSQFLAAIDQEFVEFAPVLKLPAPAKTLVAWHDAALATV